jgi:hypothetical protein
MPKVVHVANGIADHSNNDNDNHNIKTTRQKYLFVGKS